MKLPAKLILGLLLAFTPLAAHATTYYLWQSGFNGGGYISGSMEWTDVDGDGLMGYDLLNNNTAEVSSFSLSLTGNSIIPYTQFSLEILSHNAAVTLMYSATDEENFRAGVSNIVYVKNYSDFEISQEGTLIATTNPLMISTTEITQDSYNAALGIVPEPSTFALLAGAAPLALWMRRKFKKAA